MADDDRWIKFSETIGGLKAKQNSLKETMDNNHAIVSDKLDKIIDKMPVIENKAQRAHDRMDGIEPDVEEALENGRDWKGAKGRAKWIIGILGVFSAGGGLSLGTFFKNLIS